MYRKNAWLKYKDNKPVMDFAEGYKKFISVAKNERLAVIEAEKLLKANGFKNVEDVKNVKAGDRVYFINKKKNVAAFIIGKEPIENGLRILGAHIDSPRMDLKENPIYESKGFVNEPQRCKPCRDKRKNAARGPREMHEAVCAACGGVARVPFAPREDRPVYCSECFAKMREEQAPAAPAAEEPVAEAVAEAEVEPAAETEA